MKKSFSPRIILVTMVVVAAILVAAEYSSQVYAQSPLNVVLTGTFLPLKDKGDLNTYVLWVRGKKWHFKITEIKVLEPGFLDGWQVLYDIAPPHLHLIGKEKTIQQLKQGNLVGKSYHLEGSLYVADLIFHVSDAKEIPGKSGST